MPAAFAVAEQLQQVVRRGDYVPLAARLLQAPLEHSSE